ncbi:MAG: carbohydrate ABC transporter permease [Erysipelotrichaceae bacterium]|nr:carbohydrate ABC transporter permease [Erysipelotrichaceae bacterium]
MKARVFDEEADMSERKKKSEFSKYPTQDKVILIIGYILLGLFLVAIILPMVYIILASFIDPITLQNKGLTFDFSKWTLTAYERVLGNGQIWVGFKNALIYSILFTIISVVVTLLAAYPMSRPDFKGKGFFNTLFVITMFFGGGLIPTYLLISNLGMLDTIWAILIPGAFSVWNMIIARTYYMGIPRDLQEAAEIDGADEMVYFFKILLPVCTPIIATISMWQFVGMWNSYFDALIYLNSASKQPLQLVLRAILIQSQPEPGMVADMQSTAERARLAELLKYATIIISSLPLMIMYPFFQKYFDNGIMAGAVKG